MGRTRRIAMWSGPRNLSTAMMRSFGNRTDCDVMDEPFYAAWLATTGADHPMRTEILASQSQDWRVVAEDCANGPLAEGRISYQKHMTHHILPEMGRDWMDGMAHAFLIRAPEQVVASYAVKRETVTLADIGFVQQAELFSRMADRSGSAPPVVDAADIRTDPEGILRALCAALQISFQPAMLQWPTGRRTTDGIWAEHWYGAVEGSTGFSPPDSAQITLPDEAAKVAEAARPAYEELRRHALAPLASGT